MQGPHFRVASPLGGERGRGAGSTSQPRPSVPSSLRVPFRFTSSTRCLHRGSPLCLKGPSLPQPCLPGYCYTSFKPRLNDDFLLEASSCWISLQCLPWLPLLPPPDLDPTGSQLSMTLLEGKGQPLRCTQVVPSARDGPGILREPHKCLMVSKYSNGDVHSRDQG